MNATLERRLNAVHVAVARLGTSKPTKWLDDQLTGQVEAEPEEDAPRPPRKRGLSPEQAKKMAANLQGYDSKIVGGRLT